ncbi:hypothetical protein D9M68_227890 [compost metagenome]
MAHGVVDRLEAVEVDEHHRQLALVALADLAALAQPVFQQRTVGQPGEHVVAGVVGQFGLHPLLLGDVVLHTDEVGDLAVLVGHRGDVEVVPEGRAVLAEVAQHHVDFALLRQRVADFGDARLFPVRTLEEAAVAAHGLGGAVAGDALEGRVDVDHRQVVGGGVADHRAVVAGLDAALEDAQLLLRFLGVADVAEGDDPAAEGLCVQQRRTVVGDMPFAVQADLAVAVDGGRTVEVQRQVRRQGLAEQVFDALAEQFGGGRVDEVQPALPIHRQQAFADAVGNGGGEVQLFLQALFAGEHLLHQANVLQRRHCHLGELLGDGQVILVEVAVELVGQLDQAQVASAVVDQRHCQPALQRQLAGVLVAAGVQLCAAQQDRLIPGTGAGVECKAFGGQLRRPPGLVLAGKGEGFQALVVGQVEQRQVRFHQQAQLLAHEVQQRAGIEDAADAQRGIAEAAQQQGLAFGLGQGVLQLAGHAVASADVLGDAEHADDPAFDDDGQVGDVQFQLPAGAVAAAHFEALRLAVEGGAEVLEAMLDVFRLHQVGEGLAEQFGGAVVDELAAGLVEAEEAPFAVQGKHRVGVEDEQGAVALFALLQAQAVVLALDGDGRQLSGGADQLQGLVIRGAGLAQVDGEGAEHVAVVGDQRDRPAGEQAVAQGLFAVLMPERVFADVFTDHHLPAERGSAAGTRQGADGQAVQRLVVSVREARCRTQAQALVLAIHQ